MGFSLGIRTQLTAGIVLTTLAGIGLLGLFSMKVIESRAMYWKVNEAESTARFLNVVAETSSGSGAPSGGAALIEAALREAGVKDYRITDDSSSVLASGGEMPRNDTLLISSTDLVKVRKVGGGFFRGPGSELYVTSLVKGPGGALSKVEFTMPLTDIKDDLARVGRFLLIYAILDSAVIILFGIFFLSRSIIAPIRNLDDASKRIAGGRLGERADVVVDNEVGSLAVSFNIMAERLESEIKALERVNKELVTTQEELTRSSTLAAVGSLAAGIAHEIGNPLGAVLGYLDILGKGIVGKDEEKEILERTSREISRIDSIVKEFMDISRPERAPSAEVDVNNLVADTLTTLSVHDDLAGVKVATEFTAGLPPVLIDEGKLRQVFINLIFNAAHSMDAVEGEKLLTVETFEERRAVPVGRRRRRDDPPLAPESESYMEKGFVTVSFTDRGKGITEEDAAKIFDPFYTTKDIGRGTGLGLFVTQMILKTYGGEISFKSKAGAGSTFSVTLPSGEYR